MNVDHEVYSPVVIQKKQRILAPPKGTPSDPTAKFKKAPALQPKPDRRPQKTKAALAFASLHNARLISSCTSSRLKRSDVCPGMSEWVLELNSSDNPVVYMSPWVLSMTNQWIQSLKMAGSISIMNLIKKPRISWI
jgi:hypothetical protein